jgi:glucosylceramidase
MMKRALCLIPFFLYGCGGGSDGQAEPSTARASQPQPTAQPGPAPAQPPQASVWLTTYDGSRRLEAQEPVTFTEDAAAQAGANTIDVDDAQRFQTMEGFGAALTDSSAWLISTRMSSAQRAELLRKLFDPTDGIGLSLVRHGIGATDFALADYTYSDGPTGEGDSTLVQFSIDYERAHLLPVLKEAFAVSSDLRIMGTPWSAPAWMKTTQSLMGGSLRPDAYAAYASYLVKYLQSFAQEGVPIEGITVQNEPLHESAGYPTMRMEADEQAEFLKNHLGPALAQAGLTTKVFVYDHNWDQPDYAIGLLNDAGARQHVAGTAFHCYGGEVTAQSRVHDAHSDKEIRLTECTGSMGSQFGPDMVWWIRNLFIGGTRNWATAVLMWNLALDESSGPQNGGCTSCRGVVTVEQATGNVTYNGEYYALGHASLAARPGASRIESSRIAGVVDSVAFLNPDGSKGLLVLNERSESTLVKIRHAGRAFTYELPPQAVVTFKWP